MVYPFPSDVQQLAEAHLASGQYATEEEEDLAAVRKAIDEWHVGDEGTPLTKAFDHVRGINLEPEQSE